MEKRSIMKRLSEDEYREAWKKCVKDKVKYMRLNKVVAYCCTLNPKLMPKPEREIAIRHWILEMNERYGGEGEDERSET